MSELSDLDRANKLFDFLQGAVPQGFRFGKPEQIPRLTADQAETVLYVLSEDKDFQNWSVPDSIERCGVCGDLYDSDNEGSCLDFGEIPYHFCSDCDDGPEYRQKIKDAAESINYEHLKIKTAREKLLEWAARLESGGATWPRTQDAAHLRLIVAETLGEE